MPSTEYHIGPLFPRRENGELNLVVSDSLKAIKKDGRDIVKGRKNILSESLNTQLRITSNPIKIPGTDSFINEWLIPQLTDTENKESLFNQMKDSVVGGWDKHPRYENMYNLSQIGYRGPGYKNTSKNNNYWNANGSLDDKYYREISKIENYKPELRWENYSNTTEISSNFDKNALLQNIDSADGGHADHHHHTNHDDEHLEQDNPNHWMPSILYTYKIPGESTSYPGPVMMLEPGEELSIDFSNNIVQTDSKSK